MSDLSQTIADKVVSAINAKLDYSNSYSPTAVRKFLPNRVVANVEDSSSLTVQVSPLQLVAGIVDGAEIREDHKMLVIVRDKLDNGDDSDDYSETELSNLLNLCKEIRLQIISWCDVEANGLLFMSPYEQAALYDLDDMQTGQFVSATEFTFRDFLTIG